jgi:hypothetical protein
MEVYEAMTILVIVSVVYGIFIAALSLAVASLSKEQLELWGNIEELRDSIAETNGILRNKEDKWYG